MKKFAGLFMTLLVSLGMLAIVDLRMLGVCMANVPASKIAERLDKPMLIGFALMFISGILLFSCIPVRKIGAWRRADGG